MLMKFNTLEGRKCVFLRLKNRPTRRVKLAAGHCSVSGRYKRYREIAREYAFLIDLAQG